LEKCLVKKEKDSHVSVYQYESVKSELDIARSKLLTMETKITILENEKEALWQTLQGLKTSVEWTWKQLEVTFRATMSVVDAKLEPMRLRLGRVAETLNETVVFSNKTHFMEEIGALRETNAKI
jgi:predicted  nucleic acid-binding Zn-ribbon protein